MLRQKIATFEWEKKKIQQQSAWIVQTNRTIDHDYTDWILSTMKQTNI